MSWRDHVGWLGAALGGSLVGLCCLGPLVALVLGVGVGALSAFTALDPYRPWFLLAALGFWGWGFYRLYVVPARNEVCDEACERPSRLARGALWVSLAFLAVAWGYPFVLVHLFR